jgi:hypothetical protein
MPTYAVLTESMSAVSVSRFGTKTVIQEGIGATEPTRTSEAV